MTSIYDIPYEDIQKFLLANNQNFEDEKDAYDKALLLLKDKNAKGHTISIIEWMIAHNLLIRKVEIPNYTFSQINNMSQIEIDELAKLLTMKGNNRDNIKNILKYLHKLYDEINLDNNTGIDSLTKRFVEVGISIPQMQERDREVILSKLNKISDLVLLDVTNYDYYFDQNNADIWKDIRTGSSRTARRGAKTGRTARKAGVTVPRFTYGIRQKSTYDDDLKDYYIISGYPRLIVSKNNPEMYNYISTLMNDNQQ